MMTIGSYSVHVMRACINRRMYVCGFTRELAIFLVLLLVSQALRADVTASLSSQTVHEGDTVTLIVESNDRNQSGEPDLAGLQQEFEILGTRNSRQTQIINGRRTDRQQWHIELAPRNSGTVTIPAIRVGEDETTPLQLLVKKQPAAVAAGSGQPVFIKVQIEPADGAAYVQQQIQYTLQLYFREPLAEGSFDGPNVENALVERLGEDRQYETTVKGERYQVIERRHAIFPEQSGKLLIPAVVFDGRMTGALQERSAGMSSMMERFIGRNLLRAPGKRIRLRSREILLDVSARPAAYDGQYWLPSEQVVLRDSWAEGPPEFHAGEPVTRTITLEAKGLESSHLPEIRLPEPAGMRLYPEKPEHATRTDGEWVYGSRQQAVAYVPAASGRVMIPEIRVDWWDTRKQQQRSAVLPAWEVNVLPGETGSVQQPPAPLDPAEEASSHGEANVAEVASDQVPRRDTGWPWILLLAGLAVALLLLLLLLQRRHYQRSVAETTGTQGPAGKQQLKVAGSLLEQACRENDPQASARALLQWAAAKWPDDAPRNLGSLAQRLATGGREIRELDRCLYATGAGEWQGSALWQVFRQQPEAEVSDAPAGQDGLSPLYPDWKAR